MTEKNEDTRNIYQRMAAAMANVSYVQKSAGGGLQYTVVTHDAVTAKVRPALLAEGIYYHPANMVHSQNGNRTEVSLDLIFVNIADPADTLAIPCLGYGVDGQDKGPGKAVSYAVKYGLLKGMGLETGDDADNESVEHVVTISADEFIALQGKIAEAGVDEGKIVKAYGVDKLEELKSSDFPKAMARLNATIKKADKPKT